MTKSGASGGRTARSIFHRDGVDLGGIDAPEPSDGSEPSDESEARTYRPMRMSSAAIKRRLVLADLITIIVGIGAAFALQAIAGHPSAAAVSTERTLALAAIPLLLAAAGLSNMYTARANSRFRHEFHNIVHTVALGVAGMVGLTFAFKLDVSRFWVASLATSVGTMLIIERRMALRVFRRLRRTGRMSRRVLVVGADEHAVNLVRQIRLRRELGYVAVGFVGDADFEDYDGVPLLGGLERIEEVAAAYDVSGVMISLYSVGGRDLNLITRQLTDAGLHVSLCTSLEDIDAHRLRIQQFDGRSLIYIEPTIRTGWRIAAKRCFDVAIALLGLILTAPLLVLAAIAIRVEAPGSILFRQERVGRNGQRFSIVKFRTMVNDAEKMRDDLLSQNESDGPLFKMKSDPRVTRVGRLLRSLSIDELPQFWNVLCGEMSIVGPRPALPLEADQWSADLHDRLRVLPGITGMWQVSGRADASFADYKRWDLYYVDNWSLLHDLRIVAKTFVVIAMRRGAS